MVTERPTSARARILVVEDDEALAHLLTRVLEARGHEPVAVDSARGALALAQTQTFDLLLTDKNLPGDLDGLELIGLLKEKDADLTAIMITAFADLRSAVDAMRLGVYDYIVKPFVSLEDVGQRVDRALRGRQLVRQNRHLLVELERANEELRRANLDLEARVRERTRQLEQLSLTDDVTGLYNQRFLHQRLPEEVERAKRYGRPLAMLVLDLDHFKQVNDTHDHIFGSRVLKRIGEVILECVRGVDRVVRYGGDEFCVVLPETDLTGATVVAERVRRKIQATDLGDGEERFVVSASIGVAILQSGEAEPALAMLRAADRAMYEAKAGGRNRVVVASGPNCQGLTPVV